ncbi:MAG: enhanced serine sensitivity protein SseB, partial [Chitinivibrionales bacterium]|nr:enhanced serine sensitivity protein SseB [Chitinivibrionales bacterium]
HDTARSGTRPGPRVVRKDTQVMLGQPAQYPRGLVDALTELFRDSGSVNRAFLAHMHDPSSGDPPHNVIGIELVDGADMADIAEAAGLVAQEALPRSEFVDFMQVGDDDEVSGYMTRETSPFFVKGRT